jgi:hypothetical protein
MHRIRLIGLALIAAVALGALVATAAMAEKPEFSPAENNAFASSGGAAKLVQKGGPAAISMTNSLGFGELKNAKEGMLSEEFEGANAPLSGKCTDLSKAFSGTIRFKGAVKIGYLDSGKTKVGMVWNIGQVHFECEKTITLVTVEGAAIGEITPLNKSTREFLVVLTQTKGVNSFTKILNSTNLAFEEYMLKSETNGGAFAQAGLETTVKITTTKAVTIA